MNASPASEVLPIGGSDLKTFRELFAARGMTVEKLARQTRCGRSHLTQVLLGTTLIPDWVIRS